MLKVVFVLLGVCSAIFGSEVRYLSPPNISGDVVLQQVTCNRPMRKPSPRIELEEREGKLLVHNYGHGGAGWSLSYGSVKYAHDCLPKNLSKDVPIAVVGAGCIGLLTAYNLLKEGFGNITLYAEKAADLASHHAGGLLSFRASTPSKDVNETLLQICEETYSFYKQIALGNNSDFPKGARIIPTYFQTIHDSEVEDLVGRCIEPAKDVIVDFQNGVKREMIVYDDTVFIDTFHMMSTLNSLLEDTVLLQQRRIDSFDQCREKVIFNCSGLGARHLCQDNNVYPVLGHLALLKNQDIHSLSYMMIVNFQSEPDGVIRTLDFFPKQLADRSDSNVGVFGGTFIEDPSKTNDEREFKKLFERAFYFYNNKEYDCD